jgi:uncharacterized protein
MRKKPTTAHSLCDVNLLLSMASDRHDHHYPAKQWLAQQEEIGAVGVCFSTKLSLLRLLTHPAVMGVDVCTAQEAWRNADELWTESSDF